MATGATLIRRGALNDVWARHGDANAVVSFPTAADRPFWSGMDPRTRETLLAEADALHRAPWPQPLLSDWAAYARTGERSAYERALFLRNRRTRLAVIAAALDPSEARLRDAPDGLRSKLEQTT